jgi:hypothetical protein
VGPYAALQNIGDLVYFVYNGTTLAMTFTVQQGVETIPATNVSFQHTSSDCSGTRYFTHYGETVVPIAIATDTGALIYAEAGTYANTSFSSSESFPAGANVALPGTCTLQPGGSAGYLAPVHLGDAASLNIAPPLHVVLK